MKNEKLRINLTVGELELLFNLLKDHGTDEALEIRDKLTTTSYIVKKTPFDQGLFTDRDTIINIISAVMKIDPILLVDEFVLEHIPILKLRSRLNNYISSKGGRSYLINNDIEDGMTVGALYNLVINKIP